mgnify:FL=1
MNIHINGKAYALANEHTISVTAALAMHFIEPQLSSFAVALNGDFVGKADYDNTLLSSGDSLDVFQPIQGG